MPITLPLVFQAVTNQLYVKRTSREGKRPLPYIASAFIDAYRQNQPQSRHAKDLLSGESANMLVAARYALNSP